MILNPLRIVILTYLIVLVIFRWKKIKTSKESKLLLISMIALLSIFNHLLSIVDQLQGLVAPRGWAIALFLLPFMLLVFRRFRLYSNFLLSVLIFVISLGTLFVVTADGPVRVACENYVFSRFMNFSGLAVDKSPQSGEPLSVNGILIVNRPDFQVAEEDGKEFIRLRRNGESVAEILIEPGSRQISSPQFLLNLVKAYGYQPVLYEEYQGYYSFHIFGFDTESDKNLPLRGVFSTQNTLGSKSVNVVVWCKPEADELCSRAMGNIKGALHPLNPVFPWSRTNAVSSVRWFY